MFTKEYSYGGSELYKNLLRITKFKRIVFGYFIFDEHDFYGKNENSSIINVMIFLYDEEDNIVGVNYRGIFYYYVYDTQGNVISIYDEYGTTSMSYQYDAWGRIRTIYDSGCPLYNVNPITYRGYYYDNDLGLYYLQSRYYNPELCRFISADSFDYINTSNLFSSNAYVYCWNNPIAFDDIEGTTPQISIDLQKVVAFFKNANENALQKFSEHIDKLQNKFNAFAEKAKYYLLNPDELINNTLSKLFGREVKLKFWFIEALRKYAENNAKNDSESSESNETQETNNLSETYTNTYAVRSETYKSAPAKSEKTDNWFTAVLKGLVLGIEIDGITDFFEAIIKTINKSFDFNKWYMGLKVSFRNYLDELMMSFVTTMNTIFSGLSEDLLNDLYEHINDYTKGEIINYIFGEFFSSILDIFDLFNLINQNFDGTQSIDYSFVSTFADIITAIICIFVPYAAFAAEEIKKFIKDSLKNIENGNFWG